VEDALGTPRSGTGGQGGSSLWTGSRLDPGQGNQTKTSADLDREAKKKWSELIDAVDPDVDRELLGNYCRQHSTLMAIRSEKAAQLKAGTFQTMLPGRDKSLQLNPMLTAENRIVAALNRMLRALGLALNREEQDRRKKKRPYTPPPPGFSGPEPSHGWELAIALCRGLPEPTLEDLKLEKQWDEWLAARRNQGGIHGKPN
jgi:phage terminase small subunit